jgi:carbon-monoxide dehydrogenase small subunit
MAVSGALALAQAALFHFANFVSPAFVFPDSPSLPHRGGTESIAYRSGPCAADPGHPSKEASPMQVQLKVNGNSASLDVAPNTLLVHALRENLKLTGTHVGCDTAQCGACTVIVNGRAIKSCNTLAVQHDGAEVTTIEGLAAADGTMHPMQAAFKDCHGLQCGFCTPGMVMSAVDLCRHKPGASEAEIRELLEGNLCRCTGYQNIVKAVRMGQAAMASA